MRFTLRSSGNACTLPWSVIPMAVWPQRSAVSSNSSGRMIASIVLILVCKCSSTRFSGASSLRLTVLILAMARGRMNNSSSKRSRSILPDTAIALPSFKLLYHSISSGDPLAFKRIEDEPSVMPTVTVTRSPERLALVSMEKTVPSTTALVLGLVIQPIAVGSVMLKGSPIMDSADSVSKRYAPQR